ncbi:EI24 domain-containing protein [Melaminivora sp.]
MSLLMDSFWRAVVYCLLPRVILLSLLPLLLITLLTGLGAWLLWAPAVAWVQAILEGTHWLASLWAWLGQWGVAGPSGLLAPLLVVLVVLPLIVLASVLAVSLLATPALVRVVAEKRFSGLQRKPGASLPVSLAWALGSTLAALAAMLVSMPLWLIPPLVLILPPLIWGWLNYRIMAFDALSEHANKDERQEIFQRHRWQLLVMGVLCGFLGAAPGVVWISGVVFAAAFLILIPLAIWIYTLVFVFSSLWFAHFCLAALGQLRRQRGESASASGDMIQEQP